MHDKRRPLPRWQRIELVELCLKHGLLPRQAAAWRRVSVATVQYWIERYRAAATPERVSGAWADRSPLDASSPAWPGSASQVHDRICEARRLYRLGGSG